MRHELLVVEVRFDRDVVAVRQRARQIGALLGYDPLEQARIATAVSEIARNAFQYAGGGTVEFAVEAESGRPALLTIVVADRGPGIRDVSGILEGRFRSHTGAGMGIASAQRLMDHLRIEPAPGQGTCVLLSKRFPKHQPAFSARELARIARELAQHRSEDPLEEIRRQNQELVRAMDELRARQEELLRLNSELEDTNRGVVALYAELDDKAVHLRRADELKTRFLSNMSHEFRTPLNSVLALSRLLLDRVDGELTEEQAKQISFIQKNAQDLSELVNDLLDIAKVEAGRITVTPSGVEVQNVFGGLRGMFRPLLVNPLVNLVFEDASGVPRMYTDEGKLSQILRNFISNAIKFTERGQITVSARHDAAAQTVTFSVSDTGVGIPAEEQQRIFEEFAQVEHPIQRKVKGTGLGLPLAKRLTELLGGRIEVASRPGVGSTFSCTLPLAFAGVQPAEGPAVDATRHPVLVVEDDAETVMLYEKYLKGTGFQVIPAPTVAEARRRLAEFRPVAVVLDILLPGGPAWDFLVELKQHEPWRGLPVFVVSVVEDRAKGLRLGADDYFIKPLDRKKLLERLRGAIRGRPREKVLVIDDDEISRYLIRDMLADTVYQVIEAPGGFEGLRLAAEQRPGAILLDLIMPDLSGFEVLDRLTASEATRGIPVIIVSSKALTNEERTWLSGKAVAILAKESASRQEAIARLREALASAQAAQHVE